MILLLLSIWTSVEAFAGHLPLPKGTLADQLSNLRDQVSGLEQGLVAGLRTQDSARSQIKKIQKLLQLQKKERELSQKRLSELEKTVRELESRRIGLKVKVNHQQKTIRKLLVAIESSNRNEVSEKEKIEAPRRKVMANLVDHGLREIETLRADIDDASRLEVRIQEEKQQLAYLFQDLKEQASILELNRQLQLDFLKKKRHERVRQLENYQKLKNAEAQVETLIGQFNARRELEKAQDAEREVSRAMRAGVFYRLKGKLPLPVADGRIVGSFGRAFDSKSGLYVFKKGIDISTLKNEPVKAISSGKIAYSGTLPNYGQVVIIDHGDHFYSLCAHLGTILKKSHEWVQAGDSVGETGDSATPLYFEIRARNVAVNPLQWVFN